MTHAHEHSGVILRPKISEKSGIAAESKNVYTFAVSKDATKHTVAKAVAELYKVHPIAVNIITMPGKTKMRRGKPSRVSGVKKALVRLKKGDKIAFI
ncbi:MAG: 50S ribosomal protein L23 [Patescibacteria group bacterium]|nr:50S ribosomal protein L23 [Patescibacteria group bacterium]MDE1945664.1 50S ribosomal protein L23 [Patescibacteria group bacterium]